MIILVHLRIAYVTPRYTPHLGGVEYVVQNFAERLVAKGHDVTVITGEPNGKRTVEEEANKVKVIRVPTYAPNEAYHVPKDKQALINILNDDFDIVHTHSVHSVISIIPLGIKRSIKSNWKLVMTLHFSTTGYTLLRRAIWEMIWKRYIAGKLKKMAEHG